MQARADSEDVWGTFLFLVKYFKWQLQKVETLIYTKDPYKLMTERDGCVGVYPEHKELYSTMQLMFSILCDSMANITSLGTW